MATDNAYGLTPATQQTAQTSNPYGLEPATPVQKADANPYGLTPATPAPSGSQYGLTPATTATPAPTTQTAPQPITSTATIAAHTPSIWERITGLFSGIPAFNRSAFETAAQTGAPAPPMQFLTPEGAMTPVERAKHPVMTGVGQVVGGLTSPGNVLQLVGSGGLGEVGSLAESAPEVARLLSGAFGTMQVAGALKQYPELRAAARRGDASEVKRILAVMATQGVLGGLALGHAATGKSAVTGRAPKTPADAIEVETRPIAPESPLAATLQEPGNVPELRVAKSSAAKHWKARQRLPRPKAAATELRRAHPCQPQNQTRPHRLKRNGPPYLQAASG